MAKVAYDQMLELPYYNTFFKTATPPPIELSEILVELTPPGMNRVFYGSSGSDANDTIVRLVRHTDYVNLGPGDRIAQMANTSFHAATFEIWGPLLNGGTVVLLERETTLSPRRCSAYLESSRLTFCF